MTPQRAALIAVAMVVLGGCGGGGGEDSDERVDSATTSAAPTLADTTVPATAADTEPTEPAPTAAPTTTTPTTTTVAEGLIPGTGIMAVLTQGAGLGARPLLRWEPVEGAVSYVVSVNAPNGGPLWAWEGPVNEVPFGGGPADDPETTGAQLVGPATWFVAGLDANGRVLASSVPVDLAP